MIKSKSKPKFRIEVARPNQKSPDGKDDKPVIDLSGNPEKLQEFLAQMGMTMEDFEDAKANGVQKKKKGLFQKLQDILLG